MDDHIGSSGIQSLSDGGEGVGSRTHCLEVVATGPATRQRHS